MHTTSLNKMKAFVETYLMDFWDTPLVICDIGSQAVENMPTYKQFFNSPNWRYYGVDLVEGQNVDIILKDPYNWIEIEDNFADVVISGQAFEHIEFPWLTIKEIFRILKPGGLCCIIAPSSGPEHKYPYDCWRIYSDGMKALAKWAGFEVIEVFTDWGLGEWQDTFGLFQKPFTQTNEKAPFGRVVSRNVAQDVYLKSISDPMIHKNSQYYARAHYILKNQKDYNNAFYYLTTGLFNYPFTVSLRQQVVALSVEMKEPEKAIDHAMYLIKSKPITVENISLVGEFFELLSDKDKILIFQSLPLVEEELRQIAYISEEVGRFVLSSACWEKIKAINPYDIHARLMHAYCVRAKGDVELSDKLFGETLEFQLKNGILNRTTIIQKLIDTFGLNTYLEIGVERGLNFMQIRCPVKYAIDPVCMIPNLDKYEPYFFKMTSDEFFAHPPKEIVENGFDIVFIDGLHTYEQSLRDVENALKFLKSNGFIVMHDCLPDSPATAAPTFEEAKEYPEFQGNWTGDVYKTIMNLRATRDDLFVAVVETDWGVGIIKRGKPENKLNISLEKIKAMNFDEFNKAKEYYLNLKPIQWFYEFLNEINFSNKINHLNNNDI